MIIVRYGAQPNLQLYFAIEAPVNGTWFDWKTGTFISKPTTQLEPMVQDNYIPGRYTLDFSGQQKGQFPAGLELMFWLVYNTGEATPVRQVLQSYASAILINAAWALHLYELYVYIVEPP